jgi:hypothetical protein
MSLYTMLHEYSFLTDYYYIIYLQLHASKHVIQRYFQEHHLLYHVLLIIPSHNIFSKHSLYGRKHCFSYHPSMSIANATFPFIKIR